MLTAGHVTADAEFRIATGQATTDDVRVSFGKDAYDEDTWVEVEAFVTHPLYRADAANHAAGGAPLMDIGVIILKEPVDLPIAHVALDRVAQQLVREGEHQREDAVEIGLAAVDVDRSGEGGEVGHPQLGAARGRHAAGVGEDDGLEHGRRVDDDGGVGAVGHY